MAKSAAERQREYRSRRNDGEGDRRINTWVSTGTDLALDRLAKRYGVTKRQVLERLIGDADKSILCTLELDSPEWKSYFKVTQ